jgi:hypothetical protein
MQTTKLAAADRPRELYRYKVTGTGHFPIDMLRYDCAYPASQEAVSTIGADRPRAQVLGAERRTVELRSHHRPTVDRWASFGWTVE